MDERMWTQLNIPDWLVKGTVRSESDLRSDTSSEANDLDESDSDGFGAELDENISNDLEEPEELDDSMDILDRYETKRDLEEACGIRGPLELRYTPDGTHLLSDSLGPFRRNRA
jgi:hypothetical protein